MENIQNQEPPRVAQIPQNQVVAVLPKKTNRILEVINKFRDKSSELFGRFTFISPTAKKILTIALALIVIVVLIGIAFPIIKKFMQKPVEEVAIVDTTQLTLSTRKPSRYATDETVLMIESEVLTQEGEMNTLEIKEYSLNPPPLNWDVNFDE